MNSLEKNSSAPSLRCKRSHLVFAGIWLALGGILLYKFGFLFFFGFPFYFLFASIFIGWLLTGLLYLGIFVSHWSLGKLLFTIFLAIVLIPFATFFQIQYVHESAEKAFRDFVTSVEQDKISERYGLSDPEGLKCFAEDVSSNYRLGSDFFFGMYDWWIEFEDGTEYYITTVREGIFLWKVNVSCPFERGS